jgi:GTPase SAR1 family protein
MESNKMEIEEEEKQKKINELDKKFQENFEKAQQEKKKENENKNKINEEKSKIKLPKNMKTINLIVLGMAGSGKTTFVQKLEEEIANKDKESYIINLDPAVMDTLYEPNLDIRDTIKYKEVMTSNNLGPNGAILTSLNLFSTNIDKVISILESKNDLDFVVIDTPGQLEVFSWSASGKLITDSFSIIFPSILIYIIDIPRCNNPNTFSSNMLYALSIMYKMKLPLMIAFNKVDVTKDNKVIEWMQDFQSLQDALRKKDDYISTFSSSLSLLLAEFYKTIKYVSISSKTGEGFDELISKCEEIRKKYQEEVLEAQ